jgi:hypothetical protein
MEVKVMCNEYRCDDECTEHAYCDGHFDEKLRAAYDEGLGDGKKEGFDEGYEKGKLDYEPKE